MNAFKKGMIVPVLLTAFLAANAQDDQTADTTDNRSVVTAINTVEIKGTVTDAATRQPLRAIRVTYHDFSAAITDSTGHFTLRVPNDRVTIVLLGEGYQSKEIPLRGRRTISTSMYEDTYVSYYDAANLPFGKQAMNRVPFAATSVQATNNWAHVSQTPDAYLQGRVAGLNVIRRSGTPNIGANMFLRGISSLYASSQPLVVIDGIIYDNNDYGGSLIANNYTSPLSYLDVKDIDNITVIKDGSSTYGTKGANGVIYITTARAKELGTKIDVAVYGGVNFAPQNIPVMDAGQYRTYLSDLLQSAGYTSSEVNSLPYMIDDPSYPEYYRYHQQTNWQNQVMDNSSLKNYYIKVTGGDNIAKYALSLGYLTNSGITKETDLARYHTRFNADLNLSRRLTATANLSFTYNDQSLKDQGIAPKTNPLYVALVKAPFIGTNEVSASGIKSPDITDTDIFNVSNPLALINTMQGFNKNYRFMGSVGFNYSISKTLSASTIVGVTVDKIRENIFIPRKGVVDDTLQNGVIADSRLGSQTKRILSVYNDTRLSYDKNFSEVHRLSGRLGMRFLQPRIEQDINLGANSATDQLRSVGNGVAALRRTGGDIGKYRWLNTYLAADYSLLDKYFISLNVAVDGSSRFGKNVPDALAINGNSFAVMPSLAGAWLISSETFMADSRVFDLLKLRASYGMSGNDDIGNFTAKQYYISQNFLGTAGLVRANFGNDELQWESVHKLNVGVDAGLFNERLNLAFDVYRNMTYKMLVNETMPTASGISQAFTNSGTMKTTGAELSVTGRLVHKPSLKWDLGLSVGRYKSIVNRLPDPWMIVTDYAGGSYIASLKNVPNLFYGYKTNGVYASDAEASADGLGVMQANGSITPFRGGDVRFADVNGDNLIDGNDRQVIGDPNPDYFGSVSSTLAWKNFSFEAFFTFSKGNDIYNYTRRQLESQSDFNNQTTAVLNRWRNSGQVTSMPRTLFGDPVGNSRFSDRWIEDGSYFRLKSATLSYNLPFRSDFLRYSVVYVTGNNLFTLTKYLGFDPEMSASVSAWGQGVDVTLEPQFRSVQVGLRFGL